MAITYQHMEEGLSIAHVAAVASAAGINFNFAHNFDYGVDGSFHEVSMIEGKLRESGHCVHFQLKASINCRELRNQDVIAYDLDVQTYNYLIDRQGRGTPCVLIVLHLPELKPEWITHSAQEVLLRYSCYWQSITGEKSPNEGTQVVHLPKANQLTPEGLLNLIELVKDGVVV